MTAPRLEQRMLLLLCMLASFAASFAGLVYAVGWGTACDGGRGGAVAVAIAFAALFTGRPLPQAYIEARDDSGKPKFDTLPADDRIGRLRSALAVLLDRQRQESFYLALASVSGTLIWGFGDMIAGQLGAAPCP